MNMPRWCPLLFGRVKNSARGSERERSARERECRRRGGRLFDDPISAEQDPPRNRELERLRRSEVHHGVEFFWLLHRDVGRLRALEDPIHETGRTFPDIRKVDAEAEQAAEVREFAKADAREPLSL